jgi:ABC-type multidrug transport system fused ATPase/permease subunit
MFVHHYFFEATRLGLMVSSAVRACIYRKALRLSSVTTSVGEIVNLQSNDTSRIYDAMRYGHTIWLTPFIIIGALELSPSDNCRSPFSYLVNAGLLVQQVGWAAAIIGSAVCLLVIPVQTVIGRLIGSIKRATLPVTDERVRLMHEILSAIKLVKLYNWEKSFMKQTEQTREREMVGLRKVSISKGLNNAWAMWSAPLVAFVTFSICTAVEPAGKFNATSAFTALALFNVRLLFPHVDAFEPRINTVY